MRNKGQVGIDLDRLSRQAVGLDQTKQRRLQSGKAEIPALTQPGSRQRKPGRIATRGRSLDRRSTGISQPKQSGSLVERLTGRIIQKGLDLLGITTCERM